MQFLSCFLAKRISIRARLERFVRYELASEDCEVGLSAGNTTWALAPEMDVQELKDRSHSVWRACRRAGLVLTSIVILLGCAKNKQEIASEGSRNHEQKSPASAPKPAEPVGPAMHIDAERAMQYTKEIVAFGPRWDGSKALDQVRAYIKGKLKGDQVEEDAFVAPTSTGQVPMRNIIAKFPGAKDGVIVIGSHYETNYWLRKTSFVGANDGAATSALLLAIADQLRGKKLEGYSVWLVFFDGEESFVKDWDSNDALWGSRHLAQKWQADGTSKKVKAFILADMIAASDLTVYRDNNSTPWLLDLVSQAASSLGFQSFFFTSSTTITGDDHLPFRDVGIPVADLIDGEYGYGDSFHHTTEDTVDKLSVKSLKISGDVILETIRLVNAVADHPPVPPPQPRVPS